MSPLSRCGRHVQGTSFLTTRLCLILTYLQDIYPIRRAQLIHHPRASKPLGPISLLPTEVIANVFLCCVADNCDVSARSAPLVLTQVCSSWRKIALRIPQLWASFNLNLNLTVKPTLPPTSPFARHPTTTSSCSKPPQALANLVSLWFERAKNQLLSVSIKLTASNTTAVHDVSSSFIGPILSNARAIRHLSLHVTSNIQLQKFFASSGASFINLESLSLSIQHFDGNSSPLITAFNNSPRLKRVSFDLNGLPPSASLIHLPWTQLEQLDMTGASILPADAFQSLLSACKNLQKASLWVEDALDESYLASDVSTTTLANFTHLSISFYGRRKKTASSLLTAFDFPNLRHFHFFSGLITLPFMPIITSHQLRTLVLSGVNTSAAEFLVFASNNPSLRSLTLDLRYFGEDISNILEVLATGQSPPRVLPILTNLSLWTRDISPHSAAYSRMIRARGNNPLTPLHLSLYLARQQHGACCYFSTCDQVSGGSTRLDEILAVAEVCERSKGVELYVSDVKPDEGINEVVW